MAPRRRRRRRGWGALHRRRHEDPLEVTRLKPIFTLSLKVVGAVSHGHEPQIHFWGFSPVMQIQAEGGVRAQPAGVERRRQWYVRVVASPRFLSMSSVKLEWLATSPADSSSAISVMR